ncbi:Mss4-like protein [Dactylonectria estremocensis]|uniref:Mss4-like protein n=1 Tax=Dactylonectria estremocensis TaxID=1079267 RepID=A0A9P9IY86_9HYPO|nr:Mss4-like protein [Dactylonectria estremocensis]
MASDESYETWQTRPPYQTPASSSAEREQFNRKVQGSCHCGKIKFWLCRDNPLSSKYCHCQGCQVLHGAPFQWAAIVEKADVAFEDGCRGLRFYNSGSKSPGHQLPCKVSCSNCGSHIMDEGRNMALMFPTLLALNDDLIHNFQAQCHIFYSQRVVDIPDGNPKWSGLDGKSQLLEKP